MCSPSAYGLLGIALLQRKILASDTVGGAAHNCGFEAQYCCCACAGGWVLEAGVHPFRMMQLEQSSKDKIAFILPFLIFICGLRLVPL